MDDEAGNRIYLIYADLFHVGGSNTYLAIGFDLPRGCSPRYVDRDGSPKHGEFVCYMRLCTGVYENLPLFSIFIWLYIACSPSSYLASSNSGFLLAKVSLEAGKLPRLIT